ncbi:MAG: VWA domain-containing protein [Cyanobacteriota bacterium]
MKNKIFISILITVVFIFVGVIVANGQENTTPPPLMQSAPLVNPNMSQKTTTKVPDNNSCISGNCPPIGNIPPLNNNMNSSQPPVSNYNYNPQAYMPPRPQAPPPAMEEGPQNVLIILDASYSMEDRIGSDRKIDIAKRVVHNTVSQIPPGTRVGLRVYGHKIGLMGIYPCRKTELLVPISFNTSGSIISKLRNINPTGQTPITYSIKTAVMNDFIGLNGPKRIILVSDGMETCDGNPCEYAVEMVRRGIDLKVDVVGFALKDQAAINQLKCVALSTGGKFYTADTEAALARSLRNSFSVKTEVQGRILFNK